MKAALFDIDGTLVNSLEMIIRGLGDAAERLTGVRPPRRALQDSIGTPLLSQARRFVGHEVSNEDARAFSELAQAQFSVYEDLVAPYEPAMEAMRLFSVNGFRICLVTSKSTPELAGFMKRFSHAPFVTATVCSSDVLHPKPAPDSALLACQRLGVQPSEALFIGDALYDVRCAKSAGVYSVAVAYGATSANDLAAEQPDMLIQTPADLLAWVQSSFLTAPCHAKS
jgi:pyrophosphatase PpaX